MQDILKPFARTFLAYAALINNLSKRANKAQLVMQAKAFRAFHPANNKQTMSKRSKQSKQPANKDFTAAAGFSHTCLLVRRIFESK